MFTDDVGDEHGEDYNLFDEIFDIINSQPLTTSRFNEFEDTIQLNQQIINNMYNIRRFLTAEENNNINDLEDTTSDIQENIFNNIFGQQGAFNNDFVRQQSAFNNEGGAFDFVRQQGAFNNEGGTFINDIYNILNETFNQTLEQEFEDVKVTLTPEQFSKFKKLIITNENLEQYSNKPCNICIETYKEDDEITFLLCNHFFHTNCIQNWLCSEKISCPVCRADTRCEEN